MQLLKTGSVVQGKKGRYQILQTGVVSETCVSYLCRSEAGEKLRLDYYQPGAPALGEPRSRFLSLPALPGISVPADSGADPSMEFDVFRAEGADLAAHNAAVMELIRFVIPQLNVGLYYAHHYGLLIRDIRPSAILFDPVQKKAAFSGLANLAVLNGGATATKAPAKGISPLYVPPEFSSMGWSIYSDYYALGAALLVCLDGEAAFAGISPQSLAQRAARWELPGLNRAELSKTPWGMLSIEQKLRYLILGLTIPDPHQRWGFGEVRCWCAGQELPLLQTGERVRYQMTAPVTLNQVRCWDYDQTGRELLKGGQASAAQLPAVVRHIAGQNKKLAAGLQKIMADASLSPEGKVFCVGYTLAPNTTGFWWNGRCARDSAQLIGQVPAQKDRLALLGRILQDRCLSFLTVLRGANTPQQKQNLALFREMEQLESQEPGKGAARFLMRMSGGAEKTFQANGRTYRSLGQLLKDYERRPEQLQKLSPGLLQDQVFQSWAWAAGFGEAAEAAASGSQDPEKAFYAFLVLCEKMGNPEAKQLARGIWLNGGPVARVTWLKNHLRQYHCNLEQEPGFMRILRTTPWSGSVSLDEIARNTPAMEQAYGNFVRNTEENPVKLICGIPVPDKKMVEPAEAEAFFCCEEDSTDVTPGYLREKGQPLPAEQIRKWCDRSLGEAEDWINSEKKKVESVPGYSAGENEDVGEVRMILGMLVWIAVFCWVAVASMRTYGYYNSSLILAVVCIIAGVSFPVSGIFWCYSHRMVRTQRETQKKMLDQRIAELEQCRQDAKKAAVEIPGALMGGKEYPVTAKKTLQLFAGEQGLASLNTGLTGGYKVTFLLSTLAFALIMLLASTSDVVGIVSGLIYCGAISAYFCIKDELYISTALLVILGEIVSLCILWAVFGKYLLLGVLGVVIVVCSFFS